MPNSGDFLEFFTVTLQTPTSEKGVGACWWHGGSGAGSIRSANSHGNWTDVGCQSFAFLAAVNVVPEGQAAASEEPTRLRGAAAE